MMATAIGYCILESELGDLLVAATRRGVCRVRFGRGAAPLVTALRDEFPFADVRPEPARLRPWVAAFQAYLEGRAERLDVPLDVRASQFQRRVWDALQAIPFGCTRSYSEVARQLGQPRAARAVAQACGANPVALVVPCHRVVAKGGDVGGYRWGIERKRWLLRMEARQAEAARRPAPPPGSWVSTPSADRSRGWPADGCDHSGAKAHW
jgi:AraC family transcriptional regulator of adaptative response/methylated-DNA-[protein]-cysteine methyltransferase